MKITVDGNTACGTIAYKLSEVTPIYPITPSSNMSELADVLSHKQEKNIFGNVVDVVEMQSEAGAAGTMHGAISAGALATTFTSSQGLLLMIPNMYKIAGELLPNVIHVSSRAIATHALSIFGDHSDVMSVRQTGYALLCSSSVQEAQDLALVSHISTLNASVPFVHFFDGFRTSHEINTITKISDEDIKKIYPFDKVTEFKKRSLNSSHPHQQGTSQNPDIFFQNRERANEFYLNTPQIVETAMKQLEQVTNRKYNLFDYVGHETPEHIIIMMGSGATTAQSTIEFLNAKGEKFGLVKVRLYRPFSVKHFIESLPKSVKKIAVLDRTKEPGSAGEPLYKDVLSALFETKNNNIEVFGGRYGIGSKDFTPTMVQAVFNNLKQQNPKNHFTVGINDDITNTSIPLPKPLITCENRMESCKFYGFGGDGTVSANKNTIKIITQNTDLYGQAYFEYDSKKSGNATITHIRFGKEPINECYLLNNISFIACHNQSYLTKFNLLKDIKQNGIFLLNTNYNFEQLDKIIPNRIKKEMATKNIKFYTIDAYSMALKLGLKTKINLIMQTAFFKLTNLINFETAKQKIKEFAQSTYNTASPEFLDSNFKAVELTQNNLTQINYPKQWSQLVVESFNESETTNETQTYFDSFIDPIQKLEGDNLPVSTFDPRGFAPTGTSKLEKRGIATQLPCWISQNCIQCNLCSFVCPHAAIRASLVNPQNIINAPENFETLTAVGESEKQFKIQLNPLDCTGCGVCANVCPVKNKALVMKDALEIFETEKQNYEYLQTLQKEASIFASNNVKGIGFKDPYFEFSGACAGCGETPYIKVLTQLYGDSMIMANATGCSSIYGGTAPACPYTTDQDGNGVAWANSLFEDNAEFGLGIKLGANKKQAKLHELLTELKLQNLNPKLNEFIGNYFESKTAQEQRYYGKLITEILNLRTQAVPNNLMNEILNLQDSFATQSVWILGGDGWAYDIGYGGLDHVLTSGENINILVLDTEVYSNTGGQASKATPLGAVAKFASGGKRSRKKDLALIASLYKDVYVAKISMGANYNHVIKTFTEAQNYNGVSIIIAYSPCIAHGIDMSKSQESMKLAVESGYWHLWRYNPMLKLENKNPFVLDSPEPTKPLMDFLITENRYKTLLKNDPETANELFKQAQIDANETYNLYKKLSLDSF